jgi:hypothetical protein
MSVTTPVAGADVLATFGTAVADFINSRASLAAATAGITTTQTQVVGLTIPANTLTVGRTYRVTVSGTVTSSAVNVVTLRVRCGPTTLTGSILCAITPSSTNSASSDGFTFEALLTCRATGAGGTMIGEAFFVGGNSQPFGASVGHSNTTAPVTVDTTVQNVLEATIVTAAGTTTVTGRVAAIELVQQ